MPSSLPSWVGRGRIPLWIKVIYSLFVCVLVPVYWQHHGPANFLWASDIALFLVGLALWSERPLLSSMMAIGVLPFEIVWSIDFLSGARLLGVASYMFDEERPVYLRALSLFHLFLPLILFFLLHRIGYDRRALAAQTLLTWIVLPVTYFVTDPEANINLVFGWSREPQTRMHPLLYLGLEMILLPVALCWPAHRVLRSRFGRPGTGGMPSTRGGPPTRRRRGPSHTPVPGCRVRSERINGTLRSSPAGDLAHATSGIR